MADWISFVITPCDTKTSRWDVVANDRGVKLGVVKWYGGWRKYCFFPEPHTIFEEDCLRKIAEWCEVETRSYRKAKRS